MERKVALLALTWFVMSLAAVTAQGQARTGDRVTLLARPFPLTAVRLLDSPFKDAMLRDLRSDDEAAETAARSAELRGILAE